MGSGGSYDPKLHEHQERLLSILSRKLWPKSHIYEVNGPYVQQPSKLPSVYGYNFSVSAALLPPTEPVKYIQCTSLFTRKGSIEEKYTKINK